MHNVADAAGLELSATEAHPPSSIRACDNCSSMKEKCVRAHSGQACARCSRLSKRCVSSRPVKRKGRRPLRALKAPGLTAPRPVPSHALDVATASGLPATLHLYRTTVDSATQEDIRILEMMLDPERSTILMTAPQSGPALYQQSLHIFLTNQETMYDGVLAMFEVFGSLTSKVAVPYDSDANVRRGMRGLQKFQALPLTVQLSDFTVWLILGTSLLIHAHCTLIDAGPIRRYMLAQLHGLGGAGVMFLTHPIVLSLITLDIFDSLLQRRRPLLRLPEETDLGLDSFMGVSYHLVAFMHELSSLSYATACGHDKTEELHCLSSVVSAWQPTMSAAYVSLPAVEATQASTQARVSKTMILLYIHRLHFAFGASDASDTVAVFMAHSILSDLKMARSVTGQRLRYVSLPFVIAGLEIVDRVERRSILHDAEQYVSGIPSEAASQVQTFLEAVWRQRDLSSDFKWMDRLETLPPICINMFNDRSL